MKKEEKTGRREEEMKGGESREVGEGKKRRKQKGESNKEKIEIGRKKENLEKREILIRCRNIRKVKKLRKER